ncbi:arylsulfatase [Paractinoplanes lichenicola]|uniref:Arylsulfatase n=1 Tax=Paractinoplanes lichenicola TaxID=2802976 RepID=A0ABS1W0A2_9ACTN|nr:arylsulfatase [Actinoplanes lichenicola]MBL7260127.1 arylsulfatase [Actinoplanes lichenicola]
MPSPNIVLILADDLGFSDLGCYGSEIATPALDELGRQGVRLSQFYNTARCSPSRASLLTGLHPHQTGIGVLTRPDLPLGYPGTLDPACATIADRLREHGWTTWLSGKWHLAADTATPNDSWPTRRGFDRFFGTLAGCGSYYDPQTLTRQESPATDARDDPDFYYTSAIAREAAGWIDAHPGDRPYFLYLAFTAPHWPLHARPADIAPHAGAFDEGWDVLREKRLARLVEEGIIADGTPLSERDPSQPAWDDADDRAWQARRMETYAAQVRALDDGVRAVLDAIERSGRAEDTIVVFLSDNGASAEELPIGTPEQFAAKDSVLRTGTRDGRPVRPGNTAALEPGPEDTYASYGVPWANLSNTPLRKYKRWVHEGGISTPFLMRWPAGGLAARAVVHDAFQLVDVLPTLLEAAGVPAGPGEGRSMLPALRGGTVEEAALYWEHIGNAAIRVGPWKLVRDHPGRWELYNIDEDRTELDDRAAADPARVAAMARRWQEWADRVGVLNWDTMIERYAAPEQAEE